MSDTKPQLLSGTSRAVLGILVLAGAGAFAMTLSSSPERAWANYLISNTYFLGIALAAGGFMAMHYLAGAGWWVALKRIPEAMTAYLPLGGLLMLGLYFGIHTLYHWSHPEAVAKDPILAGKTPWLNENFFLLRTLIYVLLWIGLTWMLVKNSRAQDADGEVGRTRRNVKTSAGFALVYGVTFSLASIDWLMSLDPHWYSTLFPWYIISSTFVGGLAMMTALIILLRRKGYLQEINEHHFHDLGKYLFAFSVFWGYLWFSQYMLIWYSDIPEEITHFLARSKGDWLGIWLINPAINLIFPLVVLISVRSKKHESLLFASCLILILGHWLDLYQIALPVFFPEAAPFGLVEIGMFVGLGALFLLLFDRSLGGAKLLPEKDPYLVESLHHHG